ncbi:MAG: hypothetical protein K2X68_12145 [Novosphingobium sp.]|nr:hypothetical protein [Novosphingobium sp.]
MSVASQLVVSVLAAASQAAVLPTSPDFSWFLGNGENTVRSCEIVPRADGDHVIMSMAPHREGDSIHIEADFGSASYDYVFGKGAGKKGRYRIESETLSQLDQIDIPVRTAIGLNGSKAERIFTRSGTYTIYVGFNFRGSDESQISGACKIEVKVS